MCLPMIFIQVVPNFRDVPQGWTCNNWPPDLAANGLPLRMGKAVRHEPQDSGY